MKFLLASTLFILCFSNNQVLSTNEVDITRIVGGHDVSIEDFPYMAAVIYDGHAFCGGSIISKNTVLTAAHCVLNENRNNKQLLRVQVGETFSIKREARQVYKVAELWIHSNYEKPVPKENDIGIIKIKGTFRYGPEVQPISLIRDEVPCGEMVTITGWGKMEQRFRKTTVRHLEAAIVPIVCMEDCKKAYENITATPFFNDKKLCDGFIAGGIDTCQGDSGGPLMYDGKQIGIVSFGKGCADGTHPSVTTKVSAYIDWIEQFID